MDIKEIVKQTSQKLNQKNIKNPQFEAELILSFILNKSREYVLSHSEKKIKFSEKLKLKKLVNKRIKRYPLAYLTGEKYFYGYKFKVNKHVLVPRPETEQMVSEALKLSQNLENIVFIDIGTGSGCIITSIAKQLDQNPHHIYTKFFASDISKKALEIARENKKINNVNQNIIYLQGDLLIPYLNNNIFQKIASNPKTNIIITANLPYIPKKMYKKLHTIKKEPKKALVAGSDGLKYYKKLLKQIKETNLQASIYLLCEIDDSQKDSITKLLNKEISRAQLNIKKDLSNKHRLVIIKSN